MFIYWISTIESFPDFNLKRYILKLLAIASKYSFSSLKKFIGYPNAILTIYSLFVKIPIFSIYTLEGNRVFSDF